MLNKLLLLCTIVTTTTTFSMSTSFRTVNRVMPRPPKHMVGDGFEGKDCCVCTPVSINYQKNLFLTYGSFSSSPTVYPVFANLAFTNAISPMLMFDYGAPKEFPINKGKPLGVGKHPHRGFETVTIAFQGEAEHHDSTGGHGIVKEGDIQWMTAGRGIVHEEYHSREFSSRGGTLEMCQLWVNLPKKYKMVAPRYQAITKDSVPEVSLVPPGDHGATARIIAGTLNGMEGPAKTFSPVNVWDVSLPTKGSVVDIPYPQDHSGIVFVRRGSVSIDDKKLGPQDVALLNNGEAAGALQLTVLENDSAVLILGGEPLNEPIAQRGPFVMNTELELQQAMMDYHNGRF
jgi:quercetin 2,3-dioxygenase